MSWAGNGFLKLERGGFIFWLLFLRRSCESHGPWWEISHLCLHGPCPACGLICCAWLKTWSWIFWTYKIFLMLCLLEMVSTLAFWFTQWWSDSSQTELQPPGCVLHSHLETLAEL